MILVVQLGRNAPACLCGGIASRVPILGGVDTPSELCLITVSRLATSFLLLSSLFGFESCG